MLDVCDNVIDQQNKKKSCSMNILNLFTARWKMPQSIWINHVNIFEEK